MNERLHANTLTHAYVHTAHSKSDGLPLYQPCAVLQVPDLEVARLFFSEGLGELWSGP